MDVVKGFKIALIQAAVTSCKKTNLENIINAIRTAKSNSAYVAVLPECFNSPYGTKHFPNYAEPIPDGETCKILSDCAKSNDIFIVGGSIPEIDSGKYYNTCTVWNPDGKLVTKYRKIHLFDIDIPGKMTFKESDVLSPGDSPVTFNIGPCKVGLGICYDMRFFELAAIYRNQGCDMLIYPGAFNLTTGPLHWEHLLRARAIDNQVYVAGVSPASDKDDAGYIAWGHTMFLNPLGQIVASCKSEPEILYADIDLESINVTRQQIPVSYQRRHDLYSVKYVKQENLVASSHL